MKRIYAREQWYVDCKLCGSEPGMPCQPSCVASCLNRALVYVESEG